MAGWLDNYGKEENANEGFSKGEIGYSTKGRNYSPAWGGQFQNGGTVDMYGNPIIADIVRDENVARSHYDPRRNRMMLGSDFDARTPEHQLRTIAHENYHAKQFKEGRSNFDIANETPNALWARMQKRPEMMSTGEVWSDFHNRKRTEMDLDVNDLAERIPEHKLFADAFYDLGYNKVIDNAQYRNPYSMEGEAQFYEELGREFQSGGSLPGSVGFTYARTGAPSNGKYAKKTMASAQNGGKYNSNNPDPDIVNYIQYGLEGAQELAKLSGLAKIPFGVGSAFGLLDSANRNQTINPADVVGLIPNVWGQIGSELIDYERNTPERYNKFAMAKRPHLQKPILKETKQTIKDTFDHGGVIDDDMGQWSHPGEVTRINGNEITMDGVPYDVLGVSDTGDRKLMKPGKNYKFRGNRVTEFPMAKNGSELTKLDQLTNFTNYNKPTKGGWLDKYNT